MTSSEQVNAAPATADAPGADTAAEAATPASPQKADTVTREQADQIINELKSIKQNIFWLLLVAGFFAARSFFFHY
jgi:PAB1-binding protein PBP1